MAVEVKRNEYDEIDTISVDGEALSFYDDEAFVLPKALLKGCTLPEMPGDIRFEICDAYQDDIMTVGKIPYSIKRMDAETAEVRFEDGGTRKYWDGNVDFKLWMDTKRDVVSEREREIGDVKLESYDDDGAYIFLIFTATLKALKMEDIVELAEQLIQEIDGAAELTVGKPFKEIEEVQDERDFTLSLVIPLLRKLGFVNVRYTHGTREFGRDITFARSTEFDDYEFWGAQVKLGDVAGGARSDIDTIIAQADDAFKVPLYDPYTKRKETLSKLVVVISGKFTDNAIEKICEKIASHAQRNNIIFLDGERIESIATRFRRL